MTKEFKIGDRVALTDLQELDMFWEDAIQGQEGVIEDVMNLNPPAGMYKVLFDNYPDASWALEGFEITHIKS